MKTSLLLLFIFITFLGFSQTAIVNYDSANGSKYAIVTTATAAVDNSPTGANASWNFTTLIKEGETTDAYRSPTAQEVIDFPNTNSVFTATRNGVSGDVFYENNAGAISYLVVEGEGVTFRYYDYDDGTTSVIGDKAKIGTFPLSYTTPTTVNTDVVAGNFTYVPFGINGVFTGTITSEVDAYGTLTVGGTDIVAFSGAVTRLKVVQDLDLSVATGNIIQTTYNYYDDSTGNLVFRTSTLAITSFLINDTTIVTESLIEISLGVSENNISKSDLNIFPNPVNNQLNIYLSGHTKIESIMAYDVTGRKVLGAIINTKQIDVSRLKSGIYILNVETDKGSILRRFVKE